MKMKYEIINGGIVDLETGEILSFEEDGERIYSIVREIENHDSNKRLFTKEIRKSINRETKDQTHYMNWLSRGNKTLEFTKHYTTFQESETEDMNLQELGFMTRLCQNIEYETNRVVYNGRTPTNKDLQKITNSSAGSVKKYLKILEDKNLIKRTGERQAREIYVNPKYSFKGKHLDKNTIKLFEF